MRIFIFLLFVEVFLSIFYEIRAKKRRSLKAACFLTNVLFPEIHERTDD